MGARPSLRGDLREVIAGELNRFGYDAEGQPTARGVVLERLVRLLKDSGDGDPTEPLVIVADATA